MGKRIKVEAYKPEAEEIATPLEIVVDTVTGTVPVEEVVEYVPSEAEAAPEAEAEAVPYVVITDPLQGWREADTSTDVEAGGFDPKLDDVDLLAGSETDPAFVAEDFTAVEAEAEAEAEAPPVAEVPASEPEAEAPPVAAGPSIRITLGNGSTPEAVQAAVAAGLATGYTVHLIGENGAVIMTVAPPEGAARKAKTLVAPKTPREIKPKAVRSVKGPTALPVTTQNIIDLLTRDGGAKLTDFLLPVSEGGCGWATPPNAFHLQRALTKVGKVLGYDRRFKPSERIFYAMPETDMPVGVDVTAEAASAAA